MAKKNETAHEAVNPETGEVTEAQGTALAPSASEFAVSKEVAQGFKRVRTLAVPVLPFPDGAVIQCRILSKAEEGRAVENGTIKQAARLIEIESRTGQKRKLIANKVLERELASGYPDDGYVGKVFLIERLAPKAGKRYPTYLIEEIEWT